MKNSYKFYFTRNLLMIYNKVVLRTFIIPLHYTLGGKYHTCMGKCVYVCICACMKKIHEENMMKLFLRDIYK